MALGMIMQREQAAQAENGSGEYAIETHGRIS
jgi:hypothetical protein